MISFIFHLKFIRWKFFYCIKYLDNCHPFTELIDNDLSQYDFIQKQMVEHEGYLEYSWMNPNDNTPRDKSLYMTYFEPWDWIISTSSYKDEFYQLIDAKDFEEIVLSIEFGETGYPLILSKSGTFLVHPTYKGRNFTEETSEQADTVRQVLDLKNGILEYDWRNPEDTDSRSKLMAFSEIEEYDWIVISTAYKSEYYDPVSRFQRVMILVFMVNIAIMILVTSLVSKMISRPIKDLESIIVEGINGNMTFELLIEGNDEITSLSKSYNHLMYVIDKHQLELQNSLNEKALIASELENLNKNLESEIQKRTDELEESHKKLIRQEKLSSVYNLVQDLSHYINTPLGVSITSLSYIDNNLKRIRDLYKKDQLRREHVEEFFSQYDEAPEHTLNGLNRSSELIQMFRRLILNNDLMNISSFNVCHEINDIMGKMKMVDHKVTIKCFDDIELSSYVHVFRLIMELLIQNVLDHAFDEGSYGEIDIDVEISGENFHLSITDNGRGIKEDEIDKVLNPFYSTAHNDKNLGLGLSIVQNAVKYVLDGSLDIQSGLSGTSIILSWPLR